MKFNKLLSGLVWYYHNDHKQWEMWAMNTADMWEDRPMRGTERAKRCQWLKKEGKFLEKSEIVQGIAFYLQQSCYHKLFFLLNNPKYLNDS